jgi:hypothetical protein
MSSLVSKTDKYNKATQLRLDREKEGTIELNESDIQVLGYYVEPLNPNKRLILLVTLKTPYFDLLGNLQYKLPFYRSSGKYSGQQKKDNFYPFFGFMSNLNLKENKKDQLSYIKSVIKGVKIRSDIKSKLMLALWMIKCGYFTTINNLVNRQVFKSHQMKWRNVFGTAFTRYPGQNRICNGYLKKYADALGSFSTRNPSYFSDQTNIADLSPLSINRKIDDNSIFGFNINNAISWAEHKHPVRSDIDIFISSLKSNIEKNGPSGMTSHPNDETLSIPFKDYLYEIVDFLDEGSELPTARNIIDYIKDWYDLQQTGVGEELRDFLKCLSSHGQDSEKCDTKSESTGEIKKTDDIQSDGGAPAAADERQKQPIDTVVQALHRDKMVHKKKKSMKKIALFNEYIKDDPDKVLDLAGGKKRRKTKTRRKTKRRRRKKTKKRKRRKKRTRKR